MDIDKLLKTEFNLVNRAYFEKEAGLNYLRVEVDLRDLTQLTNISKEISSFLDENDSLDTIYYLDIFSPGTDESFDPENSGKYIGKNVQVKLFQHINDKNEFIGELLSFENKEIIIRWNAKGQFRKQIIAIDNIELIKKYIKIKK